MKGPSDEAVRIAVRIGEEGMWKRAHTCELAPTTREMFTAVLEAAYPIIRADVIAEVVGEPPLVPRPGKTIRDEMEELTEELNRAEEALVEADKVREALYTLTYVCSERIDEATQELGRMADEMRKRFGFV